MFANAMLALYAVANGTITRCPVRNATTIISNFAKLK